VPRLASLRSRKDDYRCPLPADGLQFVNSGECPELEPVEAKDMGHLRGACLDDTFLYRECAARHKALAAGGRENEGRERA
jgi:hypothetical protein